MYFVFMPDIIKLSAPVFDHSENDFIQEALKSGLIATNGSFIDRFEAKFSRRLKTHELVALNSGTAALHLALVLLGVVPGDEVICQSFTFCASANPIVYLGATPVFVDSHADTWNICPEILEEAILNRLSTGKKPKAIIVVDLFGMPAQFDKILQISKKYNIPVVEDAAEAVGSKFQGQACGTFGDLGIYSFNGNKIITTGGGGGLISSSTERVLKAKKLASQARENKPFYAHEEIGYNYRMTNLAAGIGLGQLRSLEEKIKNRRLIFERYKSLLKPFAGIGFLEESADSFSNRWLSTIVIDPTITGFTNQELRLALQHKQIENRFLWKPLHLQPVFANAPYYGGNTASNLFENGLCLPSSSQLSLEDQFRVVEVIRKQFKKVS